MNLIERIGRLAAEDPNRPLLLRCGIDGTIIETLSRRETLERIQGAAAYLHREGIGAGQRIALETGSSVETLILSWAAWSCGIATIPLDTTRDTIPMREYKLGLTHPAEIFKFCPTSPTTHKLSWAPGDAHEALVLFTSGTTAHPKAARLTLHNLIINAESIIQWLRITEKDRFLAVLPLHHINSTTFCLSALLAGASIAIVPRYSNMHFWQQAAHTGATLTSVVPTIIFDQLEREREYETVGHPLRLNRIQIGSAPVTAAAAEAFVHRYSIPLYQGYGQTETALRVTGVPTDLLLHEYQTLLHKNSIGTPLSWAEVEVLGEKGEVLPAHRAGELVVRGPAVMLGYVNGEEAFYEGWFRTGDIGHWEESGGRRFFYLTGRKKELIIKGGVNISPVAVENALQQISADIAQSYAFPYPDARYGEEVAAAIVWKPGIDAAAALRRLKLRLLLGSRDISTYETPRYLAEISSDKLPTTSTGKVQRTLLKDRVQARLRPCAELFTTAEHSFVVIKPHDALAGASHVLHNHCWQPLSLSEKAYAEFLDTYYLLAAVNTSGIIAGQIAFSYADHVVTCVSICSASFKPQPVAKVAVQPTPQEVRAYVLSGHDPVLNFHRTLGAELVEVIPNGRPEDERSLGYTISVRYPALTSFAFPESERISHQLIAAVRLLAADLSAPVYALSRPAGLAKHLSLNHAI